MKFRKKPVVIEAWRCSQLLRWSDSAWAKLPPQVVVQYGAGNVIFGDTFMLINTLEGQHRAEFGDMVICGVKGELYPCKPDIFAATYEPVEPPPVTERCERCGGTGTVAASGLVQSRPQSIESLSCPACGGSGVR